ncbi:MAG: cytochrome c biogenesis protein CcsA [Armatimonadota bacterium]|nr:cytochrome c biogenesis protein [bacterium]
MSAVIAAAFLYVPPAAGFAVPDAARIVIFHVPCAMISVLAYLVSTVYAIAYLKNGTIASDAKSAISAGLGFTFTALATVTGMIFAKVQWGAAWNWDPRETTILILMIVYAAYFALRGAIPGTIARARISAAYNILACVIMPYLVFVLPRMMGGLHPDRASLSIEYRIVMGAAMIGFMWLYIWLFRIHVRISEYEIAWRRARNV